MAVLAFRRWIAGAALAVMATAVQAGHQALLVGVSDYPHLVGRRLEGPANDLRLMRRLLLQMGLVDSQVQELSEAAGPAHWPTRANVLAALDRLARDGAPGDWQVVYFSGHGAQVPQTPASRSNWPEPDGFDEVFLTRDTTHWDAARHQVVGAILDDEFAAAFQRIRRRGVRLWAIFDTCHANDMTRAPASADADGGPVHRFVSAADLGVAPSATTGGQGADRGAAQAQHGDRGRVPTAPALRRAVAARGANPTAQRGAAAVRPPAGSMASEVEVAFFAAGADEPAPEETFPDPLQPEMRRRFGLFTYQLYRAAAGWHGSFADLAAAVERSYQNRSSPTPQFSGRLQTVPAFGAPAPALAQRNRPGAP